MRCKICNQIISEYDVKHCKKHDMSLIEWREFTGIKVNTLLYKRVDISSEKPYTDKHKRG